jgi:hypothetical protein
MNPSELFSLLLGAGVVLIIIYLAIIVFMILAKWFLFEKAGQPGWAAIIPVYNQIILLKTASMHWAWIFILAAAFIPIVGALAVWVVFGIIVPIRLAKNYGQSGGFAVGLILLPIVFWPILGFSKKMVWTGELENSKVEIGNELKEEPKKEEPKAE